MPSLPEVGLVDVHVLEDAYWVGVAHELTEAGYLTDEVITTGPKGKQGILKPLPSPYEFDIEVRKNYAHSLGEWLVAVRAEMEELLGDVALLAEKEPDPLGPHCGYGQTAETIAHALETFDFDVPEPYCSAYVPMKPKRLYATCCHRHGKSSPSMKDCAAEIVWILTCCAIAVCEKFKGEDSETLARNLADLSDSLSARSYAG